MFHIQNHALQGSSLNVWGKSLRTGINLFGFVAIATWVHNDSKDTMKTNQATIGNLLETNKASTEKLIETNRAATEKLIETNKAATDKLIETHMAATDRRLNKLDEVVSKYIEVMTPPPRAARRN